MVTRMGLPPLRSRGLTASKPAFSLAPSPFCVLRRYHWSNNHSFGPRTFGPFQTSEEDFSDDESCRTLLGRKPSVGQRAPSGRVLGAVGRGAEGRGSPPGRRG